MVLVLVAGICVFVAGVVAVAFGIPVKEFSVGNTLIFSGVTGSCTGLIMISLWFATREFRKIMLRSFQQSAIEKPQVARDEPSPPRDAAGSSPALADHAPSVETDASPVAGDKSTSLSPPPWQGETARGSRPRDDAPVAAESAPAVETVNAAETRPRRNLLFSSSSRKERERAAAAGSTDAGKPSANSGAASFDDAWPERRRPDAAQSARTPPTFSGGSDDVARSGNDRAPPVRATEPPAVTVLKSGVVDGMAYSLYSDGSIEAQMPEGMMRFASIDELRLHLDQRQ